MLIKFARKRKRNPAYDVYINAHTFIPLSWYERFVELYIYIVEIYPKIYKTYSAKNKNYGHTHSYGDRILCIEIKAALYYQFYTEQTHIGFDCKKMLLTEENRHSGRKQWGVHMK